METAWPGSTSRRAPMHTRKCRPAPWPCLPGPALQPHASLAIIITLELGEVLAAGVAGWPRAWLPAEGVTQEGRRSLRSLMQEGDSSGTGPRRTRRTSRQRDSQGAADTAPAPRGVIPSPSPSIGISYLINISIDPPYCFLFRCGQDEARRHARRHANKAREGLVDTGKKQDRIPLDVHGVWTIPPISATPAVRNGAPARERKVVSSSPCLTVYFASLTGVFAGVRANNNGDVGGRPGPIVFV